MTFREEIEQVIKHKRPNLNASSIKTYVSILFNLKKKLHPDGDDIKWFDESKSILEHLKDKEPQNRKTILSALFILTGDSEYNKQMLEDCKTSNDLYKEQKKQRHKKRIGLVQKRFKINIIHYWIK